MEVLQYLGKLRDGHEAIVTNATYTPYAIVTKYNPETMSWDSAYGYYSTIGEMSRDIVRLEAYAARAEMSKDLMIFSDAYDRICKNYNLIADADKDFEDAFSEEYPFNKSFDELDIGNWSFVLRQYIEGHRKIGELDLVNNQWVNNSKEN